jgi:hypothetical protein
MNTKLTLTPENKNYLIAFLTNHLIECNDDVSDLYKRRLVELITKLVPEENK